MIVVQKVQNNPSELVGTELLQLAAKLLQQIIEVPPVFCCGSEFTMFPSDGML